MVLSPRYLPQLAGDNFLDTPLRIVDAEYPNPKRRGFRSRPNCGAICNGSARLSAEVRRWRRSFARQKQVVEHEQIGLEVRLNNLLLFARIAKCKAGQFAVRLDVADL